MKKNISFEWNFDMEAAKNEGIVLVAGVNSDGSHGIGYAFCGVPENAWISLGSH